MIILYAKLISKYEIFLSQELEHFEIKLLIQRRPFIDDVDRFFDLEKIVGRSSIDDPEILGHGLVSGLYDVVENGRVLCRSDQIARTKRCAGVLADPHAKVSDGFPDIRCCTATT